MNKVLIIVYVPAIEKKYEMFIPINKKIGAIVSLLKKAINELSSDAYPIDKGASLYDKTSAQKYDDTIIVKNSNIRNGTEIVLI